MGVPVALLVQLKDHLGAHARPHHLVELEDGEQTRERAIVSHIVEVDDLSLAVDDILEMRRKLGHPNAPRSVASREG